MWVNNIAFTTKTSIMEWHYLILSPSKERIIIDSKQDGFAGVINKQRAYLLGMCARYEDNLAEQCHVIPYQPALQNPSSFIH